MGQEEEEEEEEEGVTKKKKEKRRRALYADMLDHEAEKSGSDHSDDENEDDDDEYDTSMLAREADLPSDEEELAVQLKQRYHDQQALEEKEQIKRLKERFIQEDQGFFRTRKFHGEDSNIDLFSTNLDLDLEEDDAGHDGVEAYKAAMEKRTERLKKEQFVKSREIRETGGDVDDDSQAFLDSLQDITDSTSRSGFSSSSSQNCGSFLKHRTGTLNRLSSLTSSSINSEKTSNKAYVFQTVSPAQTKRKKASQFTRDSKRPKNTSPTQQTAREPGNTTRSIFSVIK